MQDVLVEVGKFIFPVDFVILDVDEEVEVSLILGRPFLTMSKALIDVNNEQMVLWIGEEKVAFKLHQVMKHSHYEDDTCFAIDIIDDVIYECVQEIFKEDPLNVLLEQTKELV